MEYSVRELAKMSGVSTRALRYYDEIGLLKPARVAPSGYRFYGHDELDTLQQILFYRELKFPLKEIKNLLTTPGFDREKAFVDHLSALEAERKRLDILIRNITESISALKGEVTMADNKKFEGFKQQLIDKNEQRYGGEIRQKYGDKAMDESNKHIQNLTKMQYDEGEGLRREFEETLKAALETGNPAGKLAQKACDLHRQWLCVFYPKYSKEYHRGLGEMYLADERFRAHYDKLAPKCTKFLRDAIKVYCS